jgi:peptidoglycan/xylan/chitin deacetylase (PgdA/CDA1 family)
MASTTVIDKLADTADELFCRISNGRIHLLTELGKRVLPAGYWGHKSQPNEDQPTLYLTFDDGPDPRTTPPLLELLAKHGIKATFFLIGSNCRRHPRLVERIKADGHVIGNHSYNHVLMPLQSASQIRREITLTNDVIEEITGERPTLFRPPFGLMDERTAACLKQENMTAVYWNSAPEDWLIPGTQRIIRRVMWKIADGTLIVLHEGAHLAEQTAAAAQEIITRSQQLGYQFSKVNVRA